MSRLLFASLLSAAALTMAPLTGFAASNAGKKPEKAASALKAKDAKTKDSKARDVKTQDDPKDRKPKAALKLTEEKKVDRSNAPASASEATTKGVSPLLGAFQSSDGFLVTIIEPPEAKPSVVMATLIAPYRPERPYCMMFGESRITSPTQTTLTVTQFQSKSGDFTSAACTVTLGAEKNRMTVSGHSPECDQICGSYKNPFIPKQTLVRLSD